MSGYETLEEKTDRLAREFRQFGDQVREDQRNRKMTIAPAAEETREEVIARVHSSKPAPLAAADPDALPMTGIRLNGQEIEDFGDRERTFSAKFVLSGGKEFNLRNNSDVHAFMEKYWPGFDYSSSQWPGIYNALQLQGRLSTDKAGEFALNLKAGHAVIAAEDLPH